MRFISEVQHRKDAYVSVEVSTKDRVPLNPKPLLTTTKVKFNSPLSIPTKRRAIQTFQDSTTKLGCSQVMHSLLGNKSPRVTNMNEIVNEDERSALAQVSGSLKDLLQSSLKCSRIKREAYE
jgi:hypothetical protein